jgi:hypothetical protein
MNMRGDKHSIKMKTRETEAEFYEVMAFSNSTWKWNIG